MRVEFAEQYGRPCLVIEGTEPFEEVIMGAYDAEATFNDGEDECLIVQFPGRPQELYTEEALRRSLRRNGEPSK